MPRKRRTYTSPGSPVGTGRPSSSSSAISILGAAHQMRVIVVHHPERLHEGERGLGVGGGAQRALGLSGRPAGVDHGAAESLGGIDGRIVRAALLEELVEARGPGPVL